MTEMLKVESTPTVGGKAATVPRRSATTQSKRLVFIWASLAPILLYFLIFSLLPIVAAFYISLQSWPLMGGERVFVGFKHYSEILQSSRFYASLWNTAYFALAYMASVIVLGLGMALLVNSLGPRMRLLARPIYFAPQVTSVVAVALMFTWLYEPRTGVLNYLLSFIGVGPFLWLRSQEMVMPALIATAVWRSVGYSMVIFTAGLLSIPRELYDAVAVDGAGRWTTFRHLTVPLLRPTLLFMFVTATIGGFQVFVEPWLMSGGGPGTASRVIMLDIYDEGFRFFEMGSASALAVCLFLVIAVIAYIQMRYLRESFEF
jgi:multiple sugar transport system permease protein